MTRYLITGLFLLVLSARGFGWTLTATPDSSTGATISPAPASFESASSDGTGFQYGIQYQRTQQPPVAFDDGAIYQPNFNYDLVVTDPSIGAGSASDLYFTIGTSLSRIGYASIATFSWIYPRNSFSGLIGNAFTYNEGLTSYVGNSINVHMDNSKYPAYADAAGDYPTSQWVQTPLITTYTVGLHKEQVGAQWQYHGKVSFGSRKAWVTANGQFNYSFQAGCSIQASAISLYKFVFTGISVATGPNP